jgi:LacI family transcriptional regulator
MGFHDNARRKRRLRYFRSAGNRIPAAFASQSESLAKASHLDSMKKRILLFKASAQSSDRLSRDGVFQHAREAGWNVQVVGETVTHEKPHPDDGAPPIDAAWLVKFWRPDGVIVQCGGIAPAFDPASFGTVPVVFLDCYPGQAGRDAVCVHSDAASIARLAARELLSSGIDDFAFAPFFENLPWSQARGGEFARIVRMNGKRFHLLESKRGEKSVQALADQLGRLPLPCGVFAVSDIVARLVIMACETAGLDVPGDVAVVGVDNDAELCENASVTLSSIALDVQSAGRQAARLLDARMADPTAPAATEIFGARALVRRASSRRFRDRRIAAALERIRREACHGITPVEVARSMGVSRRFADRLFTSAVGHSIFEEIRAARIARVKELLANPRQGLSAISDFCGYRNPSELCRDFRRATGTTLTAWRKDAISR